MTVRRFRSRSKLSNQLSGRRQAINRIKKFHNLLITRSSQSIVFESKRRSLIFTESFYWKFLLKDGRGRKHVVVQQFDKFCRIDLVSLTLNS